MRYKLWQWTHWRRVRRFNAYLDARLREHIAELCDQELDRIFSGITKGEQ